MSVLAGSVAVAGFKLWVGWVSIKYMAVHGCVQWPLFCQRGQIGRQSLQTQLVVIAA